MLVLTRKKGEAIILNDNIEVVIVGIDGEQVKLGINAPKNIDVHRKEVYLAIQEENMSAVANHSTEAIENLKNLLQKK